MHECTKKLIEKCTDSLPLGFHEVSVLSLLHNSDMLLGSGLHTKAF